MTRILVFGDSNSWGFPPDGQGVRFGPSIRWPQVMATALGIDVIEDCLPGRTTRIDDSELLGPDLAHTPNGLLHLPSAMAAQSPLDRLIVMLGTNDLKTRFDQSAEQIADNIAALVALAQRVGGRRDSWDDLTPPQITVIVPVPIGPLATDPTWERAAEWRGAYDKSRAIAAALPPMNGVQIINAADFASTSAIDPIHMDAENQIALGQGVASLLRV